MTFRRRLQLFFTTIVIVPMLATTAVLFTLTAESKRGQSDARLAAGLELLLSLYEEAQELARDNVRPIAFDGRLTVARENGDDRAVRRRLRQLVEADAQIVSARLTGTSGEKIATSGSPRGVAFTRTRLLSRNDRRQLGTLSVSVIDARALVRSAARRIDLEFVILRDDRVLATTVPGIRTIPADTRDFKAAGRDYRASRVVADKFRAAAEEVAVLQEAGGVNSAISESRIAIAAIIAAFLLLALVASVFVVRALQTQIRQFLAVARRLAEGKFDQRVPVPEEGGDEFAGLGREVNKMSAQLEAKMLEVDRKRADLQGTIERLGEPFARALESQQVVEFVVRTALDACEAESARAVPAGPGSFNESHAGRQDAELARALDQAERALGSVASLARSPKSPDGGGAGSDGRDAPVAVQREDVYALAVPLFAHHGSETSAAIVGVMSTARRKRPFAHSEAEMLRLLAGFAGVWIENADLYATVQQQAVTDPQTGLPNQRAMDDVIDAELARHDRSKAPIGLVWLDLDNFKSINDTHGHDQGNEVLNAVAGVLRRESRQQIDTPARRHGDEFAVVLPDTDLDGAKELAHRIRRRLEALRIPLLERDGEVRVTASVGVAAVPANAVKSRELVKVADDALYRAKRAGGNRVELAGASVI